MSQERPFGKSGAEHHPEHNHPQPTEEAMVAVPTLNFFWRMMTDPGFPSPVSNPALFVVTVEVFLGLSSQVQALAGMMRTIVPYLPQLVHSTAHQSAPPVAKARVASPSPMLARSQSRSCDPIQTELDLGALSGEVGESSKGGSPFTPEIQAKPLPATFRLPALEPYDGSDDPTEHITAFPRPKPTTASLLRMAQGSDEPLSQFVGRFTSQVQGIPYLHPSLAIQAFLTGLR
ncbi:hypothetical protein B296_00037161 [Ensete ventricosum]|uniref:Retrotransposon gag domain-containing protein n=1 Tax=Ensete ventricosum TaxID=4639 RepID=A0A426YAC3_ENSVE|nr:hypothetical protein B296_00037161 [Ensete ventricosum]